MDSLAIVTAGLSQSGGGYTNAYIITWGMLGTLGGAGTAFRHRGFIRRRRR